MNINVLACDPGAKGAICFLQLSDDSPPKIAFIDNSNTIISIFNWLNNITQTNHITMAMIEDVHSLFGMSAKSNFNFGKNVGISETLFISQGIRLDKVQPKIWQKFIGITAKGKQIKQEVADICERLYPNCDIRGTRGGLMDGRSDALMLAHYCAHKHK